MAAANLDTSMAKISGPCIVTHVGVTSLAQEKLGGFLGSDVALTMVEKDPILLLGVASSERRHRGIFQPCST